MQNQNNVKRTWQIMKEISSANKFKFDSFPKKLKSKETETTKPYEMANEVTRSLPELAQI